MGLWQRIKRMFRAGTGAALDKIENPEMVLQQTVRDMRDRVPELNNSVAQVMATERLLHKNKERLETEVVNLDSKIRAAVKMGRDDIATAYIGQLQQAQVDLEKTGAQLEYAENASQQALKARDNYVLNMKKRTAEAMQLISASKQAKLQEQLAQTMESFDIGDDASTFNEMREKIDRRVAAAEAKLQLGSASVDNQMQDIEREAMDIQLQDKLLSYKKDLGLLGEGSGSDAKQISAGNADEIESVESEESSGEGEEKSTEDLLAEAEKLLKDTNNN
ncbi:MAG: PspA/IM30 family protein [Acidobacteria bacterium]|nr:MAG: PspA/IM30 family protein [Acidobacteriota bacterium]REK02249.1 MAG: PspA/IM30 family protein [Acidobacteriota bacterium]REK13948.1 MAG: PspA/IM30 family protein [Acidobacteriota bacterium]REK41942.1 MAG: PspA/IM30 family protein [Acidobacteriota bacterium]